MLKTSPERRAAVRASKKKTRVHYDPQKDREYFREYARKTKNRRNEQRRARRHRDGQKTKLDKHEKEQRFGNLSIVSAASAQHDRTRWRGPGWMRELELELLADALLGIKKFKETERKPKPKEREAK